MPLPAHVQASLTRGLQPQVALEEELAALDLAEEKEEVVVDDENFELPANVLLVRDALTAQRVAEMLTSEQHRGRVFACDTEVQFISGFGLAFTSTLIMDAGLMAALSSSRLLKLHISC